LSGGRLVVKPFRWFGGKGLLINKLLPWVGLGKIYVEPFCGGASLFWNKRPHPVEVLNDLNRDVINVFRCLQDGKAFERLAHRLTWTPYSLAEFRRALEILEGGESDWVARAWAFLVAYGQGFGGMAFEWGRSLKKSSGPCYWRSRLRFLEQWHERLRGVYLECGDGLEAIRKWDGEETLFYVDPPYLLDVRQGGGYNYEMTAEQHKALLELLIRVNGYVLLSAYPNGLYDRVLRGAGWKEERVSVVSHAAGRVKSSRLRGKGAAKIGVPRVEVLWVSPRLWEGFRVGG